MTHDLLKLVVSALDAEVIRVDVTELVDGTFFANLILLRNGDEVSVSSRPSDAIALAARTGAPIFADRTLLEDAGVEIEEDGQEEEIERFREFLEDVTPEDFGSGHPHDS
jgi:bifunctional DNase/RNase